MLFEEEKKEEIKILHCSVTRPSPLSKFFNVFSRRPATFICIFNCVYQCKQFCHYRRLTNNSLCFKISELSQKGYFQFFLLNIS